MKGRRVRLTDAGVGRLKPDTTEYAVWDSEVPGLGVRVRPSPRHPDKPLSDTLHLWSRARKEAGLDDVRLHDLRHTVASQAVARGVPLSTVARMLGRADPVMMAGA